ncbi:STAS domain-containing protein [Singulisphaera rosea]
MPLVSPQHLRVQQIGFTQIVSFAKPYLQTEDEIQKAGLELVGLVEDKTHAKVLLSFDGVRFISSSVLAHVVRLQKKLTKTKGKLRLCSLTPQLQDILRASQLDKLLEVYPNEKAALADF